MKKITALVLLATALTSFAATNEIPAAHSADARAIVREFQKRASTEKSAYMEFTQERRLKMFTEPLITEGVMLISNPDKIRWETTAPYQTIMLAEKKNVAQFEFNNGKWEKLNLGFPQALQRVMQQMSAMNQGKMDSMLNDFTVSATGGDETVLTLVPKSEMVRGVMSSLEIHLSPDLSKTRTVVMNEPNGDLTRITFHAEKYGVEYPAGTFDQTKPLDIAAVKAAVKNAP
jgi:outer membrane lipoprotein-sorting protein